MNRLVWKLLRQHISVGQLAGFFLANLFGMMIVLLSVQFYRDVLPVFTEGDSFMKKDYIIATKKISTLGSFAGKSNTFSKDEIKRPESPTFHQRGRRVHSFLVQSLCRTRYAGRPVSACRQRCFSSLYPTNMWMSVWTNGILMKIPG